MPGRRGERRRPVTALTTGRWAATLLTLALLSPLAGVAHGSGDPAPAPSRAPSASRATNVNATCEARYARAVSELPATLKETLLLRTVEGLSQAETAAALGISGKAVETRLRRARERLSKILDFA